MVKDDEKMVHKNLWLLDVHQNNNKKHHGITQNELLWTHQTFNPKPFLARQMNEARSNHGRSFQTFHLVLA